MSKIVEDIIQRRCENAARVIDEYLFPQPDLRRSIDADSELSRMAARLKMTPAKLIELRAFVQRANKQCDERFAREKVLLYKLNEDRTRMSLVGFMTVGEAVRIVPIVVCEILDLDFLYGGIFVREGYLFFSEAKLANGLGRYEPGKLIDGLLCEGRTASRHAA